jgi:hypothetical protein
VFVCYVDVHILVYTSPKQYWPSFKIEFEKDSIVKSLNKVINPSQNTNPFNHQWSNIKLYTSVKDGTSDKDEFGQLINPRYLDDVFNFKTNLPVLTRKVRVWFDGRTEHLHMREVQVFDYSGVNRALSKTANQQSTVEPQSASSAVDGKNDTYSMTGNKDGKYHISDCNFPHNYVSLYSFLLTSLIFFLNKGPEKNSWWEVDFGETVTVKNVRIFNYYDKNGKKREKVSGRLSWAKVSLIDNANNIKETVQIEDTTNKDVIDISFGLGGGSNAEVPAWKSSASPTGGPLLTDDCKMQLRAQFYETMDMFDSSIALVFGNKTTIGQVCSFAKGLKSKTVTNIPGFCCLDAPYQSKIEEWGEKVSSGDALMKENRN